MDELLSLQVTEADAGIRIDRFIACEQPDLSRSRIQGMIEEGDVVLNGQSIRNSRKVRPGDHILIRIPEPRSMDIEAEPIPLEIVYEDEDLLVVNKPKGMVVHPAPGVTSGTLVNALLYHFSGHLSGINGVLRPGIVHRIDKDTAGLLVVCKSDRAHIRMAEKLKEHDIQREYRAIVHHNVLQDQGTIDAPIGRDLRDRKKMAIVPDGRVARTHYEVLERFGELTYIRATLDTGRTHQIRVHMRSIGHPLLGDPVYGPENVYGGAKNLLRGIREEELEGQLLVAKVLGFVHPVTGEYLHFECELPERFEKVLSVLRKSNNIVSE